MLVLNVHRAYGTADVSCKHDHVSIRAAQHCRRLQTRRWPAGLSWSGKEVTTYTIRAAKRKPRKR